MSLTPGRGVIVMLTARGDATSSEKLTLDMSFESNYTSCYIIGERMSSIVILISMATLILAVWCAVDLQNARRQYRHKFRHKSEGFPLWWVRTNRANLCAAVGVYILVVLVVFFSAALKWPPLLTSFLFCFIYGIGFIASDLLKKGSTSRGSHQRSSLRRSFRRWWRPINLAQNTHQPSLRRLVSRLWNDIKPDNQTRRPSLLKQTGAWWNGLNPSVRYFIGIFASIAAILFLISLDLTLSSRSVVFSLVVVALVLVGFIFKDLKTRPAVSADRARRFSIWRKIIRKWTNLATPVKYVTGFLFSITGVLVLLSGGSANQQGAPLLPPFVSNILLLVFLLLVVGFGAYGLKFEWNSFRAIRRHRRK